MARMRPVYYYQRQADNAQARADYYRTRQPPPEGQAVTSRGPSTTLYYRSLILKSGTDHRFYTVNVLNDNLQRLPAADAGLLAALPAGESSSPIRNSGVRPSRIHWYSGSAAAVVRRTAWNTAWTQYYDAGQRSHYSVPFCIATGAFSADDLVAQFDLLFGAAGSRRALLGAQNGRAYVQFEKANISSNS